MIKYDPNIKESDAAWEWNKEKATSIFDHNSLVAFDGYSKLSQIVCNPSDKINEETI